MKTIKKSFFLSKITFFANLMNLMIFRKIVFERRMEDFTIINLKLLLYSGSQCRPASFRLVGKHNPPIYPAPDNFWAGSARERSDSGRPAQKLSEGCEITGKCLPINLEDLRIDLYLWNHFETHRSFIRIYVDKARTQAVNHLSWNILKEFLWIRIKGRQSIIRIGICYKNICV